MTVTERLRAEGKINTTAKLQFSGDSEHLQFCLSKPPLTAADGSLKNKKPSAVDLA